MAPAEEAVEITKLFVELILAPRPDRTHTRRVPCNPPNFFRERINPRVRADSLAVLHTEIEKLACALPIGKHSRNHERSEEIALSAFVDTEMRLEHFRRMHFLIAKPRFAENFGLEGELHQIQNTPPFHKNL